MLTLDTEKSYQEYKTKNYEQTGANHHNRRR